MLRWQVLGVATAAGQSEGDSLEVGMQRTVMLGLCDSHRLLHVLIETSASPQRTVSLRWLGMAFVTLLELLLDTTGWMSILGMFSPKHIY